MKHDAFSSDAHLRFGIDGQGEGERFGEGWLICLASLKPAPNWVGMAVQLTGVALSSECSRRAEKPKAPSAIPRYSHAHLCRRGVVEGAFGFSTLLRGWDWFPTPWGKANPIIGGLTALGGLVSSVTTGAGFRPFGVTIIPASNLPPGRT